MLYAFFWVIPRHLNFICWRFGTLCLFHLHRWVGVCRILHTPTCLWRWNRQCSKTLASKIQTLGNYPEGSIQWTIICLKHVRDNLSEINYKKTCTSYWSFSHITCIIQHNVSVWEESIFLLPMCAITLHNLARN